MSTGREREREAFQLICEADKEGLLQFDMWKTIGACSREGSRIALKLEAEGIIKRQKELHEGRWTYRLTSLRRPITLNSILDCPCLSCDDMDRCIPEGQIRPSLCPKLTYWINAHTNNIKINLNQKRARAKPNFFIRSISTRELL